MQASLATWGWTYHISEACTDAADVRVYAVPCIADHELPATALPQFADAPPLALRQRNSDESSSDGSSITPTAFPFPVHTILQSVSCRYAVMFGDVLDGVGMTAIVRQLAVAHLPFHCAHGRPTTCCIVNTCALHKLLKGRRAVVNSRSGCPKEAETTCLSTRLRRQLQ